jgi:hypothetical protein
LPIGEFIISLNARNMICKMPKPMQNWNTAPYSTVWDAGLMGAGKYIPVVGTWARVKLVKKLTTSSQRLEGRLTT